MSQLYVDNIRNRTGGPIGIPTGAVVTGVLTATTANVTGNMTVGGELTYEDVTNIDSVGVITARGGIEFGASGVGGTITATGQAEFAGIVTASGIRVGTAITIDATSGIITATSFSGPFSASTGSFTSDVDIADKIIHTGDTNTAIRFPAADTFTVETAGSERVRVSAAGKVSIGNESSPLGTLHVKEGDSGVTSADIHQDTLFLENNGNAGLTIATPNTNTGYLTFADPEDSNIGQIIYRHSDNSMSMFVNTEEKLRITSTGGVHFNNAELVERVKITSGKLSDNANINLDNGMVHYFTTEETTTSTPNIMNTAGINTTLAVGDTLAVTIGITTGSYAARISIDGLLTGITTYWNGGSAPDAAGDTGKDIYTYQIIKTADETFDVLANVTNYGV